MHEHDPYVGSKLIATFVGGTFSGLLAGLVMLAVAVMSAAAAGLGSSLPLRLIASVRYGPDALVVGQEALMVGMLVHLLVSAILGVLFAALTSRQATIGMALLFGLAWAAVVWMVMTWVVLPISAPPLYAWTQMVPVWWFVLHLVFGAALLLTPVLERAIGGTPTGLAPA